MINSRAEQSQGWKVDAESKDLPYKAGDLNSIPQPTDLDAQEIHHLVHFTYVDLSVNFIAQPFCQKKL